MFSGDVLDLAVMRRLEVFIHENDTLLDRFKSAPQPSKASAADYNSMPRCCSTQRLPSSIVSR